MRTVHETEALRPSDPVPKSMQSGPTGRTGKLKIIIKTPQSQSAGQDDGDDANGEVPPSECFTALTSELFTEEELELPLAKLWRKCHWEATWVGTRCLFKDLYSSTEDPSRPHARWIG